MVDAPEMIIRIYQYMATLAISVVGNNVEHGHRAQLIMQFRAIIEEREVMQRRVMVDKQLQ